MLFSNPLLKDVVERTTVLYRLYGSDVMQAIKERVLDNIETDGDWGPENPETGARPHRLIDELRNSVDDEELRNLLPTEVICLHGQPASTNATRAANINYFWLQYQSFSMAGTPFRSVNPGGESTSLINTALSELPPDTVLVYSGWRDSRIPVQEKYFWTVPPVTDAFVWADPSAAYYDTPRQQTTGRTAFNLESLLAMMEDYIEKWGS